MTLKEKISRGENEQQSIRLNLSDPFEIAQILSSFANTNGGNLLVGVNGNGKIKGVNPVEELQLVTIALELYCKPIVLFSTEIWNEGHKLVFDVRVESSKTKPHTAHNSDGKRAIYTRVGKESVVANKIQTRVWSKLANFKKKEVLLTEKETSFMRLIESNEKTTLSMLYRNSDLSMKEVDDLLVFLICNELVQQEVIDEGIVYRLRE
jgi:predicted HTH transcriptional regulator